jgi:hypothetical protein
MLPKAHAAVSTNVTAAPQEETYDGVYSGGVQSRRVFSDLH